jgi:sugar phosphate isomerase/epimerase
MSSHRRQFLRDSAALLGSLSCCGGLRSQEGTAGQATCRFGLVTYLWGKDLGLPDLIDVCRQSDVLGVELRTTHRHAVEPNLSEAQRLEVRARFADSPVTLVGLGSNERFDMPDAGQVRAAIEASKAFVRLSHDVGSSGVKVKGDQFHPDVPRQQTLDQVVRSLRELGDYAGQFDQQIRLEVHGGFQELPVHHQIISQVDHPRVRTCWNSNAADLAGAGLPANFALVKDFLGQTAHIHQLDQPDYPWAELFRLFVQHGFRGWMLLEASGEVPRAELVARLREQRGLFDQLLQQATRAVGTRD